MSGSTFGTLFQVTTFGESHGAALGVIVDGCPAGLLLTQATIKPYLDRRKPGQTMYSTPRTEEDQVEILSGVFNDYTTGCPIALMVKNQNQRSKDYSDLATCYRPGHADYTFDAKYGIRDYRGGGRSSGRETLARVAAGAIASTFLKELGITVYAYTKSIGPISIDPNTTNLEDRWKSPFYMPDLTASKKAEVYLQELIQQKDSAGGIIECVITGMPSGIGEPVFDKLDASLAKAIFSIGAVKGLEFGSGFRAATMTGSCHNDSFFIQNEKISKRTNHSGGILGGMSDGSPILFRAAIKPTPSIGMNQETVTKEKIPTTIMVKGRHDPIIVPRAVVVVEAMAALTIADALLQNMSSRLDKIKQFYKEI